MKSRFTQSLFARLPIALILIISAFVFSAAAGPHSKGPGKKADTKKTAAKKNDRNAKDTRHGKATANNKTDRNDKKGNVADRRAKEAKRRKEEAERRTAIEAERRRREEARRAAIARALAFERGLRNTTVENISRDKTEGEDLRIRQAAINALGNRAGSVVVMEAQTGKVLTIVNQDWAVRSTIRPCSTVKLVTGVAALNEGVISKQDGSIKGVPYRRNLDDALAFSDNGYFQRAGMQVGNQKMVEYGTKLGLGQPTGINLDGEAAGKLPTNDSDRRIYSHGDGTEVSTLQLAVLASEITNGGHRVLPRVPRNEVDKARFQPFYKAEVNVPRENVRRLIPGMMGAAEYGTARRNMDQTLGVAGKTGSCIDKGSWVGLFASVAPVENPKYAVAVITRGQHERGKFAAAVAADVYRSLAANIVRSDRNLAWTEFKIKPHTVKPPVSADDEDDDAADTTAATNSAAPAGGDTNINDVNDLLMNNTQKVTVVRVVPKASDRKLVTRTGDSKPLYQPQPAEQRPATKAPEYKPAQPAATPKKDVPKPSFPPVVITYDKSGADRPRL
ncbi:MAG: penicillin-binding transpeptidase domain-containing protein [Pyrinomonadaceae bacterium]